MARTKTTEAKVEEVPEVDPWDELFSDLTVGEELPERKTIRKVEVPQKIVDVVEKHYHDRKPGYMPVRDDEHYDELRTVLASAASQSPLNIATRATQVEVNQDLRDKVASLAHHEDGVRLIRFTVSGKPGRPKKAKTSEPAKPKTETAESNDSE